VVAVYEAASDAADRARRGEGPTLIEAQTYRFDEHQVGLFVPEPYRPPEEVTQYRTQRDPIALFRRTLLQQGCSEIELEGIETEVAQCVADAIRFAEDSPLPDPSTVYEYMYSQPIDYPGKAVAGTPRSVR
jgi:pyruvate dehydrogenase E1 component alpha subunit